MDLSDLEKELLAYCVEDDMGLWVIIHSVFGDGYPNYPKLPEWVQEKTLQTISSLLTKELVIIGQFVEKENDIIFVPFVGISKEIVKKIKCEWTKLDRNPSLGDICWFRASDKGIQLAEILRLET